ncbi:hypothetical protein [Micromonospora sp. NPDC050200]|uniref:hypothetical protein n=1 Tax=Micromonospora sp. NPDC050200 TaxID=3155664 RepID=UPI0033E8AF2E
MADLTYPKGRLAMKDRILKGLKRKASSIVVRRRRKDSVINKPTGARRPGRVFQ